MTNASETTPLAILLVEDNPADARLVIELFRESSSLTPRVRHVTRIADAIDALAGEDFDVVLLDLSLPDGVGLTTVQRIRASAPHVPVVVLTGLGDEDAAIGAVHEGAQDYLSKSEIDGAGLIRAIRYAIGRHERMHRMAYHDPLTGLTNRMLFRDRVVQALARTSRYGERSALLFIDLDGFKSVNDSYGHQTGDRVLRLVAARINACLRSSDIVGRHGGDEFTVLLARLERYEDAALVAENLRARIAQPQAVGGKEVTVGASIGVALFPADGNDIDALLHHADAAMYAAKRAASNRRRALVAG